MRPGLSCDRGSDVPSCRPPPERVAPRRSPRPLSHATNSTSSQNRLERRLAAPPSARDERHPYVESRWANPACSKGTLLSKQPTWQLPSARLHQPTPPSKQ